jgi:chaperonin GroEL
MLQAVEAPIRTLLANAGLNVGRLLSEIEAAGPGHGCDVRSGSVVDMAKAGIRDSAAVQLAAVRGAIGSAALALTVDVLVHRRKPVRALEP